MFVDLLEVLIWHSFGVGAKLKKPVQGARASGAPWAIRGDALELRLSTWSPTPSTNKV